MKFQRFYIEQKIGNQGEIIIPDQELIHQLLSVLRFSVGDQIIIFDGSSFEYQAEIISLTKKNATMKILSCENKKALNSGAALYLSLIKKNNFELAAEKCTEIGVTEIHPIISERSEKKDLNIDRLNKIVKEASEQSGRVTLPTVFEIKTLEEAVSQVVKEGKEGVVFHTVPDSSTAPSPSSSDEGKSPKEIAIFVGPEGGWTDAEISLFKQNNFQIKSLGVNIFRAETAAMIAVWEGLK